MAGLSEAQWNELLAFWDKYVAPSSSEHGKHILIRMFDADKATQALFSKYKDIPTSDLAANADVKKHGGVVVDFLGKLLKLKGQNDSQLHTMAESHKNKHRIPLDYFQLISTVIDVYVYENLPGEYGPVRESLKAALSQIANGLKANYAKV
ncbi:myoglobin-like [Protopterus annectens]